MRRRLSYANVMATLAFFFALTGGAMAVNKYLTANDPITAGDLTGTYGTPLIGDGKVTSSKLAASARMWAVVDANGAVLRASKSGVTVVHPNDLGEYHVNFGSGVPDLRSCAAVASSFDGSIAAGVGPLDAQTEGVTLGNFANWPFSVIVFC